MRGLAPARLVGPPLVDYILSQGRRIAEPAPRIQSVGIGSQRLLGGLYGIRRSSGG